MRHFLLITLLTLSINAIDLRVSLNTLTIQDCEGTGGTLAYAISPKFEIESTYTEAYLRGVKIGNTKESWNSFQTQRLGVRYYLKSYLDSQIRLFVSIGGEYLYKNTKLTDKTDTFNSYGLFGVDFAIDSSWNMEFLMGSSGKGEDATKLLNTPNYAHGFNSIVSIGYRF